MDNFWRLVLSKTGIVKNSFASYVRKIQPSCWSQTACFFSFFFAGKGSIDKANEEVRNIILRIWPKTSMELLDKVVQPPGVRE